MTTRLEPARSGELLGERPRLSTLGALGQALAIGPIVSVGFGMFLLAGTSGASTPFVILLVGAGSLALGWCVSRYACRCAGAGAVYEYVAHRFSAGAGVVAAGLFFLPALVANGTALITSLLWQDFAVEELGFDPGWWTGGVISIVAVSFVVYRGVRVSTSAILLLTALSSIPFVVTAMAILLDGGPEGHLPSAFTPEHTGGADLSRAVLFGILLFIGFEAAASTGEEATVPYRSIPRAILLSIMIVGGFYLLMSYAGIVGFGPTQVASTWGGDPTAFASLGDRYVGSPTSMLMSLGILVDALAVQVAVFNQFSRGYFALARDGFLPAPLARVSRHATPVGGLVAVGASTSVVLAFAATLDDRFDTFEVLATALTLTSLPTFVLLAVGSVGLVRGRLRRRAQAAVATVAAAVPVLGIYGTFDPWPTGLRAAGAALAGAMGLGVVLWWGVLARRRRDMLAGAARHALVASPAGVEDG